MTGVRSPVSAVALLAIATAASGQHEPQWSPDHKRYAVAEEGQTVGQGQERERIVVYTSVGVRVAVASVWTVQPDGAIRAGIRGCERWGWVDAARVFCEGTINPSTSIYLVFDASTGRELDEGIGGRFTWSPDRKHLANHGNVPHFSSWEEKSDSLEVDGKEVYPNDEEGKKRHWFLTDPVWSIDSRRVAVVDYERTSKRLFLVVRPLAAKATEYPLPWTISADEDAPAPTFSVRWQATGVIVEHDGRQQPGAAK